MDDFICFFFFFGKFNEPAFIGPELENKLLICNKNKILFLHFSLAASSASAWSEDYGQQQQYPSNFHNNYYPNFQTRNFDNFYPSNQFDRTYSKCQCMRLKYCQPILNTLSQAPKPLSTNLILDIRHKACGYADTDPLVCCPLEPRNRRNSYDGYDEEYTTTEKPWVWGVEKDGENDAYDHKISLHSRFNYDWEFYNYKHMLDDIANHYRPHHHGHHKYPRKKFFFFDFEDPHTFKNCPPSISDEFEAPDEFKHVKPVKNFHPIHVPLDESNPAVVTVINPSATDSNLIFSTGLPPTTTHPTPVDPKTLPADKIALLNSPSCGVSINNRIIGGEDAGPGQFPW